MVSHFRSVKTTTEVLYLPEKKPRCMDAPNIFMYILFCVRWRFLFLWSFSNFDFEMYSGHEVPIPIQLCTSQNKVAQGRPVMLREKKWPRIMSKSAPICDQIQKSTERKKKGDLSFSHRFSNFVEFSNPILPIFMWFPLFVWIRNYYQFFGTTAEKKGISSIWMRESCHILTLVNPNWVDCAASKAFQSVRYEYDQAIIKSNTTTVVSSYIRNFFTRSS